MKNIFLIIILLLNLNVKANMAEPIDRGTLGSSPFISSYVNVIHEDIYVKIDQFFKTAKYEVTYQIDALKDSINIPFLFYASEYLNDFTVTIDGYEIKTKEAPDDYYVPHDSLFSDFSYFFEKPTLNEYSDVLINEKESRGFYVSTRDMIYFETDITKGKHTIKVTYNATVWEDRWDMIKEYSFRYALSPVKYWKSFGTLNITINAEDYSKNITTNLGEPTIGDENKVAMWKLDSIPSDIFHIIHKPKASSFAIMLSNFGSKNLALSLCILLALIQLFVLIKMRKKYPQKRNFTFNIIAILLIPLVFVSGWFFFNYFIDFTLGDAASERHGYTILVFLLYPIILPIYWLFFFLINKTIKKAI